MCRPPCSPGMFECRDGALCVPGQAVCDGHRQCFDMSDESVEVCPCNDPDMFTCTRDGVEVCLRRENMEEYRCNREWSCDVGSDESVYRALYLLPCTSCLPDSHFQCADGTCIPLTDTCSGYPKCPGYSDLSDLSPSLCSNCSAPHLLHCKILGQDTCVHTSLQCSPGVECPSDEEAFPCFFQCPDSEGHTDGEGHIPSRNVCNGYSDCSDGSDEGSICRPPCSPGMFECLDGAQCVRDEQEGDGNCDCRDGSDESESICFKCLDGKKSIKSTSVGDGDCNCLDGSDESQSLCFKCLDGIKSIKSSWVCDDDSDCSDGSDEGSICRPPCSAGMFECHDGTQCVPGQKVGDGNCDCSDGSDEQQYQCFQCLDGIKSIDSSWVCDGDSACNDGSDEGSVCRPSCSPGMFECHDGTQCVPGQKVCDGQQQCSDWSDESVELCPCTDPTRFTCIRNGVEVCLINRYQCNGNPDCDDWSDELPSQCGGRGRKVENFPESKILRSKTFWTTK